MTNIIENITDRQRNVIIGTILGGNSIIKPKNGQNCYLSMRSKNINWLGFKINELQNLASPHSFLESGTFRWNSKCLPNFNEFKEKFYKKDTRSLKLDDLSLLKDIAIAVWFVDCGKIENNKAIFNTHIWGEKGTKIIVDFFGKIDYNVELTKERGKYYRVVLDEDSTQKLLKLIMPHIGVYL